MIQYNKLTFEQKLLHTLEHPAPEMRLLAIQLLGGLDSQAAVPELEKLLGTEKKDIYTLRETLEALSKIKGSRSREILQKATQHPFPAIRRLAESLLDDRHIDSDGE